MLRRTLVVSLLAITAFLTGCATKPQLPIGLSQGTVSNQAPVVGLVTTAAPKPDTVFPGAGCLLCMAFANASNNKLTTYAQTLKVDELVSVKQDIVAEIRAKGQPLVVIDEPLNVRDLPNVAHEPGFAGKNFSALGSKYGVDRLIVIEWINAGFIRTYSGYIPTSDGKAEIHAVGYMVDLKTNQLLWYAPIDTIKSADGAWDEAPTFPGLTNAYFQAIEMTKDQLRTPFAN